MPGLELMAASRRLAERIGVNPPQAVWATKRLVREGHHASLPILLHLSATAQAIAHASEEHREALGRSARS